MRSTFLLYKNTAMAHGHVVKVNLSYQDCFKELKHGAKNIRKSQAYDF